MAIKGIAITVQYTAWDTGNNVGKTADAANHTLRCITDGSVTTLATSASEVDSTNCPGIYSISLSSSQMNGNVVTLAGKSSTSGVSIIPLTITTEGGKLINIEDEALGKWVLNPSANTLTLYRQDGTTVLKTFTLTIGSGVPSYTQRV